MNSEDFCTYEQALAFKKLGFDWCCTYVFTPEVYLHHKGIFSFDCLEREGYVNAPTLAQVQKWLRINHKIFVTTNTYFKDYRKGDYSNPEYEYIIVDMRKDNRADRTDSSYKAILFNTPEEALSAGITECLKLLEK